MFRFHLRRSGRSHLPTTLAVGHVVRLLGCAATLAACTADRPGLTGPAPTSARAPAGISLDALPDSPGSCLLVTLTSEGSYRARVASMPLPAGAASGGRVI